MPYIGLTPFLPQNRINSLKMSVECVNALYRAYSISTKTKKTDYASIKLVSMPYIGLTPFLLVRIARELGYRVQVSMPYIGLTPFLLTDCEHDDIISHEEVSMPYIGLTPFLPQMYSMYHMLPNCVNALYRAYSISTYLTQKEKNA